MNNREIRQRAWSITRSSFGLILTASLIMSLVMVLGVVLIEMMTPAGSFGQEAMATILTLTFIVALANTIYTLLLSVGHARMMVDLWQGDPTGLAKLFQHKRRCLTLLGAYFLVYFNILLPTIAVAAIIGVLSMLSESLFAVVSVVLFLAAFVYIFRIAMRLSMFMTYIALCPEWNARDCLRASWRASKGNIGRLICNTIMLNLPLLGIQLMLSIFGTILTQLSGRTLSSVGGMIVAIATSLITIIMSGYITLGNIGLHIELLGGDRPAGILTESEVILDDQP